MAFKTDQLIEDTAPPVTQDVKGLTFQRHFMTSGIHPFDTVNWVKRDARITKPDGTIVFEQLGVLFPDFWSQTAVDIVSQKYFAGRENSPQRENSLKQIVLRVVDTITNYGLKEGYFNKDNAAIFHSELCYLLIHQYAFFASPVWFNIGVKGSIQQGSSCFILNVEDDMNSILNWYVEEGKIFSNGSGSGVNLSKLRGKNEPLSGGGFASGSLSFMSAADKSASVIKSAGRVRRSAKMVILNVDHPDIEDFIWCKAKEEKKAHILIAAGYDDSIDGEVYQTVSFQNGNNSVGITDAFMREVLREPEVGKWFTTYRTSGKVAKEYNARDLFRQMAEASHTCGDPGAFYLDTCNKWHTTPSSGSIESPNPCVRRGTKLLTNKGWIPVEQLVDYHDENGFICAPMIFDGENYVPGRVWYTGVKSLVRIHVQDSMGFETTLDCTPDHKISVCVDSRIHGWVRWEEASKVAGLALPRVFSPDRYFKVVKVEELVEKDDVYDFSVKSPLHQGVANDVLISNCSEFIRTNNEACNLSSFNLLKFLNDDGSYDTDGFTHAVDIMITAMEILVGYAEYPTQKITENSHKYRTLGLGYNNLGGLLMVKGFPYDCDKGRDYAASITALMTGRAYKQSAEIAKVKGPFEGFTLDRSAMLNVMEKHWQAIPYGRLDDSVWDEVILAWSDAKQLGSIYGYRNAQVSLAMPGGCLTPNALVATDGGLLRLGTLGDPDGSKWQDINCVVMTDVGEQQVTKFFINGFESVVEVETKRGYRLRGTPTHRIRVFQEGKLIWKRLAEVVEDDVVPLHMNQQVGDPRVVELPDFPKAYHNQGNGSAPLEMSADLSEFIGAFMANGSWHEKGLRFHVSVGDYEVHDRLVSLARSLFDLDAQIEYHQEKASVSIYVNSTQLASWWYVCGFNKLQRKGGYSSRIPDVILRTNDRTIYCAFLRGIFDHDGSIRGGVPSFSNQSREFVGDVQSLMLFLGFPSKLGTFIGGYSGRPVYDVQLANCSFNNSWLEDVGFYSLRKKSLVRTDWVVYGKYDYIPMDRDFLNDLIPVTHPLRKDCICHLRNNNGLPRELALKINNEVGNVTLTYLLQFFYDQVESSVLCGDEPTYDLSVPTNKTYVANGFISHNTVSFALDCATTGVEPEIGLIKYKKLSGGGTIRQVNQLVPLALKNLGCSDATIGNIVACIESGQAIDTLGVDLPFEVFDCAFPSPSGRSIPWEGHVKMCAAIQPFLSGGISKSVNLPNSSTVEDVEKAYMMAWELGLKSISIYRDGCKFQQPVTTQQATRSGNATSTPLEALQMPKDVSTNSMQGEALQSIVDGVNAECDRIEANIAQDQVAYLQKLREASHPQRKRLPDERAALTHKFTLNGAEGYLTIGLYDDGSPGEVFLKMAKEGSTISGLMDTIAVSWSLALQYGVPLEALVTKFSHTRFEPAGFSQNTDIPTASSVIDYVVRYMASKFLKSDPIGVSPVVSHSSVGQVVSTSVRPDLVLSGYTLDAPICIECGSMCLRRAGNCWCCEVCGSSTGCG